MRSALFLATELCLSAGLALSQGTSINAPGAAPNRPAYITHVIVIDTATGKESPDRTVVISGDRISEVKASKKATPPAGAKVVDGKGRYLIPGLWDMHVHTWFEPATYPLYIANGVTGVRDMWGPPRPILGKAPDAKTFRLELAATQVLAPHFYLASPIIDGHPKTWPGSVEVNTPEEARKVVDEQVRNGADFIKIYNRLSREAYFAIIDESRRQEIPVEGHLPTLITAWEASNAGQKSVEHLSGIAVACSTREEELRPKIAAAADLKERYRLTTAEAWPSYSEAKCERLFREFKKNSTWQVPTLTVLRSTGMLNDEQFRRDDRVRFFGGVYRDALVAKDDFRFKTFTAEDFAMQRQVFAHDQKLVGAMFRAGVPMLAGTDAHNPFCFPGFSLHDELALLVESGVSALGALQAATRNAAIFMEATDKYGSVAPGRVADLVVLDADPLKDIHNTTKISEVFLSGKEFDRAALDQMLRNAEAAAATTPSSSN